MWGGTGLPSPPTQSPSVAILAQVVGSSCKRLPARNYSQSRNGVEMRQMLSALGSALEVVSALQGDLREEALPSQAGSGKAAVHRPQHDRAFLGHESHARSAAEMFSVWYWDRSQLPVPML